MKIFILLSFFLSFSQCMSLFGKCINSSCRSSKAAAVNAAPTQAKPKKRAISTSGYLTIANLYLKEIDVVGDILLVHHFASFMKEYTWAGINGVKEFDALAERCFREFPAYFTNYIHDPKLMKGLRTNNPITKLTKKLTTSLRGVFRIIHIDVKREYMSIYLEDFEYIGANKQLVQKVLDMFKDPASSIPIEYVVPFQYAFDVGEAYDRICLEQGKC